MGTAPPLTRRLPAASRLAVIVLPALSPKAVSMPVAVLKLPEMAIVVVLSKLCAEVRQCVEVEGAGVGPAFDHLPWSADVASV
jgi:hypothetical protein